jgi:proline iminopeptidase
MKNDKELRAFYPEILPNEEHLLQVSPIHQIYVASYGNPSGIPIIALHGGPGSGTEPYFAQFFNPKHYHIILADQRGAGKSLPKGEMRDNTTQDLINDMEIIREFFKIKQWVVFGGSWGSALALLYAEAHPTKVLGLILRGIFLVRTHDFDAFVRDDCPAALFHSKEWAQFKLDTEQLINQSGLPLSVTSDRIYHIYYKLLQEGTIESKTVAAGTLAAWEKLNSNLEMIVKESHVDHSPDGVNMGLTEATYFEHGCFIKPNQILDEIHTLKNIPIYIVQGIYDLVCPPYQADELESALLAINEDKTLITRHNCLAGHSHKEPGIRDKLIVSQEQLFERLMGKN